MIIPFLFLTDPVLLFWILVFAFQAFILLDLPVVHLNALWKAIVLSLPAKITVPSGNPVQYERGNLSATQTIRYVDRAKTRWPWWKHFDGIQLVCFWIWSLNWGWRGRWHAKYVGSIPRVTGETPPNLAVLISRVSSPGSNRVLITLNLVKLIVRYSSSQLNYNGSRRSGQIATPRVMKWKMTCS